LLTGRPRRARAPTLKFPANACACARRAPWHENCNSLLEFATLRSAEADNRASDPKEEPSMKFPKSWTPLTLAASLLALPVAALVIVTSMAAYSSWLWRKKRRRTG